MHEGGGSHTLRKKQNKQPTPPSPVPQAAAAGAAAGADPAASVAAAAGQQQQQQQQQHDGDDLCRLLFDYVGRYVYFPLKWGGEPWPNAWFERRDWNTLSKQQQQEEQRYDGVGDGSGSKVVGGKVVRPFFADARDGWMW